MGLTRRDVLVAGSAGGTALASAFFSPGSAGAQDEAVELVERLTGRAPTVSDRLHLVMPAEFPTGYTVPMDLDIDSPMTEADHVRRIRVFAPQNPLLEVASFDFVPRRSVARVSTRIRLAEPQHVVAVAEMSDGTLLMTKTWVDVATNGCTEGQRRRTMTTPTPRVIVPSAAAKGEIIQVKTIISHQMETGLRHDSQGQVIPRKIINRFVCRYGGKWCSVSISTRPFRPTPSSNSICARRKAAGSSSSGKRTAAASIAWSTNSRSLEMAAIELQRRSSDGTRARCAAEQNRLNGRPRKTVHA